MGLFLERGRHWLALIGLRRSRRGFTFIELVLAIAILGVVATLALPRYSDYRDRVQIAKAVTDIKDIEANLQHYYADNRGYPGDLSVIGMAGKLDPWGNPYQYTDLDDLKGKGKAKARKDKNLHPISSDFDLWSMGKDGQTAIPLTAKASRDDIIRAADGRFIGLASDFDP
jgi:general secretion pathway protein G